MTTTPDPAVCGARHPDAVGAVLACELPAGHATAHRAHTTPDQYEAWTDDAAGTPATNPCRATYETPTARTIRRATEEAESAKACERETFADLAAERAAHEEHRQQLADALRINPDRLRDWDETIKAARDIAKLREDNQQRFEQAERAHEAHRGDLANALGTIDGLDWPSLLRRAEQVVTARITWKNTAAEIEADRDRLAAELTDARQRAATAEERATGWEQRCIAADRARAGALTRARRAEATLTRVRDAVAEAKACGTEDGLCPVCADGGGHHAAIERALGDDQPTPDAPEVQHCCVCGSTHVAYRNYADMPFCGPCADCGCGETPCTRTGINDPTTSAEPQRDQSPTVHVHLDNRGAVYHPWPPEMRAEPEPEQPADSEDEPELIPVLDYAIHRLFAAIRNTLKEHQ